MATLTSFQELNCTQVLKGNDLVPERLLRPKTRRNVSTTISIRTREYKIVEKTEQTHILPPQMPEIVVAPQIVNYGTEGETIEFKTSFFFKDERVQQTEQACAVVKEICAFLNHKGGVLYIGVDDSGKVRGVNNDIDYLDTYIRSDYKNKGKEFTYSGKDGYKRWIAKIIRRKIELVSKHSIDIKMEFDKNGVLVITVPKGVYDVAKLDNGNAYVRRNSECVLMSEEAIAQLRGLRQKEATMPEHEHKAKEFASIVRNAIRSKRKVYLHNYCSGNSRKVSNRVLEIFECDTNNEYVYAYEEASGLVKQFKLCRAESIEVMDKTWEYEKMHVRQERDIFNMTRSDVSQSETVEIEMSLRAKTLLEEEYPNSKRDLHPKSATEWVLNTTVANMLGVGRFCAGLLDEIYIVRGDMLRGYITNYILRQAYQYCF